MTAPKHSVSVAGVVVDGAGRVLAIRRRDNGQWEPPGGVLELGEQLHDGLRREVLEETGLVVDPVALTGIYQNLPRGIVALVFRCEQVGGELATTEESSAFAWLTSDDVRNQMTEAYAVRLLDALAWDEAGTAGPVIRSHDGVRLFAGAAG